MMTENSISPSSTDKKTTILTDITNTPPHTPPHIPLKSKINNRTSINSGKREIKKQLFSQQSANFPLPLSSELTPTWPSTISFFDNFMEYWQLTTSTLDYSSPNLSIGYTPPNTSPTSSDTSTNTLDTTTETLTSITLPSFDITEEKIETEEENLTPHYIEINNNGHKQKLYLTSQNLGTGSYGSVVIGNIYDNNNIKEFAVKIMKYSENFKFAQQNEAEILKKLGKLIHAEKIGVNFYIVMPYIPNSITLKEFLKLYPNLSTLDKLKIITNIIKKLEVMHNEYGIVHGDLSLNNILIKLSNKSSTTTINLEDPETIEIIDFGCANTLEKNGISKCMKEAHSFCSQGDDSYLPPEYDPSLINSIVKENETIMSEVSLDSTVLAWANYNKQPMQNGFIDFLLEKENKFGFMGTFSDLYALGWNIRKYMNIDLLDDLIGKMCDHNPFKRITINEVKEIVNKLLDEEKTIQLQLQATLPLLQEERDTFGSTAKVTLLSTLPNTPPRSTMSTTPPRSPVLMRSITPPNSSPLRSTDSILPPTPARPARTARRKTIKRVI